MKILAEIGLSQREISVYKALLKLGSTTTGPLVKESEVQNAKIYETLEKLIKRGLATFIYRGKIKHFQATSPNNLLSFFENKKENLLTAVEQLNTLQKKNEPAHQTRVYEGFKAIQSAFFEMYDLIGSNSEYCALPISDENLEKEELQLFWTQVFQKRLRMKIHIRSMPNVKTRRIFNKHYKKILKLMQVRYTKQEFPNGVFIFKDHVLSVVWGDKPVAFLVKSKENTQVWQKFFDEQWKNAQG